MKRILKKIHCEIGIFIFRSKSTQPFSYLDCVGDRCEVEAVISAPCRQRVCVLSEDVGDSGLKWAVGVGVVLVVLGLGLFYCLKKRICCFARPRLQNPEAGQASETPLTWREALPLLCPMMAQATPTSATPTSAATTSAVTTSAMTASAPEVIEIQPIAGKANGAKEKNSDVKATESNVQSDLEVAEAASAPPPSYEEIERVTIVDMDEIV